MSLRPGVRAVLAAMVLAITTSACDDQVKYVPWFATMTSQPSVETYEAEPMAPVAGTVPAGFERNLDLLAADTLLTNPLAGTPEEVERGRVLFLQFCVVCHGDEGKGDGPVVDFHNFEPAAFETVLREWPKAVLRIGG